VRTGEQALVRVSDGWRLGAISAKVCARFRSGSGSCRTLRLGPGTVTRRVRMRLGAPGRWTIPTRGEASRRRSFLNWPAHEDVLSPDGVFHESILFGGCRRIVRRPVEKAPAS